MTNRKTLSLLNSEKQSELMDFRAVLVEYEDNNRNFLGNSGIMLNNGYILTTLNTVAAFFTQSDYQNIANKQSDQVMELNFRHKVTKMSFFVYFKDDKNNSTCSNRAYFSNYLFSENIIQSTKSIFHNWSIDYPDNNKNYNLMSLFVILKIDGSKKLFRKDISLWFDKLSKASLRKGQGLRCLSTAFGNRNFLDHCSVGIVSNILGKNDCLVFSDLPLTPGSEGSPVYCDSLCPFPIGIVISVINWWKNELLNFTVIADLRQLLQEIRGQSDDSISILHRLFTNNSRSKLLDVVESSLFQIYSGNIWGTAVLIERDKGIFITNAHVVDAKKENIIYANKPILCDLVYATDEDHLLDVAILKAKTKLGTFCQAANISRREFRCGDLVYAAGFPIFPKETNMGPTITEGHISHYHRQMIKTTCRVYPGASGGAILDQEGGLIAIIVCNAKTTNPLNKVYPNVNMNIPISLLEPILENYLKNEDVKYLDQISKIDVSAWNCFSKL